MSDAQSAFHLARLAAQLMLESGGEIYRVEETVQRICAALGYPQVEVIAIPVGIFMTLELPDRQITTTVKRIRDRTIDLSAVAAVNQISREIAGGHITPEDATERLTGMRQTARPFWRLALAAAFSSGFFALLLGGGWQEFLAALVCGLAIQTVRRYLAGDYQAFVLFSLLGGMTAALVALLAVGILRQSSLQTIITGAIMPLVPGLAMTHAVRDTMRGDLVSGVTKAAEALLTTVLIAVGVGLVLALRIFDLSGATANPVPVGYDRTAYGLVLAFAFSGMATLFFAGLFHAPRQAMPVAAAIGGGGYLVWLAVTRMIGAEFWAFFLATLLMAIASEILARVMKMPASVFITTAIIPIVPGIGLYQTMLLIVQEDLPEAFRQGTSTLAAIGTMALALAINSLLMQSLYRRQSGAGKEDPDAG